MTDTVELQQLTDTDPMRRQINTGLMVQWINADLINRADHDVRHSLVFYDIDKMFVAALPPIFGPTPNEGLVAALLDAGVRFYSTGIV